jgi:hypothetical protein
MVTVAGPRRIHTGFLYKCAVFGGWSQNSTPSRSIASMRREAHRAEGRRGDADMLRAMASPPTEPSAVAAARSGCQMSTLGTDPTDVTKVEMAETVVVARMTL